jgi:hypothetical protein
MSESVGLKELLRRKIEAAYCNDEFTKEAALDYLRQGTEQRHLSSSTLFPNLHVPGAKDDKGKPMAGVLLDFSRALQIVVDVGTYGAKKYTRAGWATVPEGSQRYLDAMMRHLLAMDVDPDGLDKETGLPHLAHVAWNALAVLELQARGKETF